MYAQCETRIHYVQRPRTHHINGSPARAGPRAESGERGEESWRALTRGGAGAGASKGAVSTYAKRRETSNVREEERRGVGGIRGDKVSAPGREGGAS